MEYLQNGLRLISKRTQTNSILGVVCLVRTGSFYEKASESGLANLTQSLLVKGTDNYTASELAIALESQGISMSTDTSEDYVSLSAVATIEQLDKVLELMAEVIFNTSFPEAEIEKEKNNAIASIYIHEDNKSYLALKNLREILFEGHPYARIPSGEPETISAITRKSIMDFHERFYKPPNMILSIVGDIPEKELKESVRTHFDVPSLEFVELVSATKTFNPTIKTRTLEKPMEQGFVALGYMGVPMDHQDYPALRVACALLGEGMASRLFTHLRDRQGLAYAVGSFYLKLKLNGSIVGFIGTRPDSIENARLRMRTMFENLCEQPIPEEELERAKNYIIGKYLVGHETNIQQAFYLAWFSMLDLGLDFDEKYPEIIRSVTVEDVKRVAKKYLHSPSEVVLIPEKENENER